MLSSFEAFISRKYKFDGKYFIRGGFWLSITQSFTILMGVISTALFANYLTSESYGLYKYLVSLAGIFAAFSLTGLGQSILQTTAMGYWGFYRETFKLNAAYNAGVSITALTGSVYYLINQNITLSLGCVAIALFQPAINQFQFIPTLLYGAKKFKESTIQQIFRSLTVTSTSLIALTLTKNILILFTTFLIAQAVVNYIGERHYQTKQKIQTPSEQLNKYVLYAKHTSIRNIISSIAQRLDMVLIFTQLGGSELAIYTIATIIPEQIKTSFKGIATLLLPKYSAHPNPKIITDSISRRGFQLFILLSFISIGYILISPFFYKILFPTYSESIIYSQILALSFPAFVFFIPYSALMTKLEEGKLYKLTIITSVCQILFVIFGILLYGLTGAIIAKIAYRYIYLAMSILLLRD